MNWISFFVDVDILSLIILLIFAFIAGFVDAVVGGGGLIQLPALLIQFPQTALPVLFGTNKIAAFSGTFSSALHYGKRIRFNVYLVIIIGFLAAISSFLGAKMVSKTNILVLKPIILFVLIFILIYSIFKKDLGHAQSQPVSLKRRLIFGSILAVILGFYDGFFGPGTGSFFVLGFVVLLGFDFLHASAYAKVINSITNISALVVFLLQGNFILPLAVVMALANILGNITGTKTALKKGNHFIRIFFIIVVSLLILRYAYDIFR